MNLIVDTHEHEDTKAFWIQFETTHPNIHIIFKELPAGDITTDSMKLGFEFKKKDDFIQSISDGRLPEYQSAKLLQTYQQAFIIVAGTLNMNDNVIRGTIASCFARGVPVIQMLSFYDVMMLTTTILEKYNDGKDRGCCHHLKPKIIENPQLSVLCGIPGINTKKAKLLLDHYGTIQAIANVDEPSRIMNSVKGIGKKLSDNIFHTLHDERPKIPVW